MLVPLQGAAARLQLALWSLVLASLQPAAARYFVQRCLWSLHARLGAAAAAGNSVGSGAWVLVPL